MSRRSVLPLVALTAAALALAGCGSTVAEPSEISAAQEPHWSYEGASGPLGWGALDPGFASCATGSRQSPVDVPSSIPATTGSSIDIATRQSEGELEDTGHTVQLQDDGDGSTVSFAGADYELVQMHVHTPSEHTVDGVAADAEFHFVHQDASGARLVLSVLAEEGEASAGYGSFAESSAALAEAEDGTELALDVAALLPASLDHVAYEGSLTTPPCTEGVQWILLTTPVQLSAEQLSDLDAAHPGNTRPTQPMGDRLFTAGTGTLRAE